MFDKAKAERAVKFMELLNLTGYIVTGKHRDWETYRDWETRAVIVTS